MAALVKICGISDETGLDAALAAGADLVGFVFFPRSPRHLTLDRASALATRASGRTRRVALTVDADDETLAAIVAAVDLDLIQCHGGEPPERLAAIRARFGLPVAKAVPIGSADDVRALAAAEPPADLLLLDAAAPAGADRPGGHGTPFDWSMLAGLRLGRPWLLAGGLHAGNVAEALAAAGADGVDVSSGVERAAGIKDPARIAAFVAAARAAPGPGEAAPRSVAS